MKSQQANQTVQGVEFKQHRSREDAGPGNDQSEWLYLEDYLVQAGNSLDCWFVLEGVGWTESRDSAIQAAKISRGNSTTIEALVTKLRRELDGVRIDAIQQPHKRTVIRIVEIPLVERKGYALDQPVTVTFSGTLHKLLSVLHEQVSEIGPVTGGGIPMEPDDYQTETEIEVTARSIRDVLIDAVPLPNYGRILWRAVTYDEGSGRNTEVRFLGGGKPEARGSTIESEK